MFKRSQQEVSNNSKNWYQDKYQNVLTQRNVFALIAVISLVTAAMAVLAVMRLAPLKTVEPYLLQIDEKTGITQRVNPVSRNEYAANASVDRYFTGNYLRLREGYNLNILRYNYNVVRLMSKPDIFRTYRQQIDPTNDTGFAKALGTYGQRDVKIRSMVYLTGSGDAGRSDSRSKIIQARITTTESTPNSSPKSTLWVVTVTFEYANLDLTEEEQWLNPLGYMVTSYQIQKEID